MTRRQFHLASWLLLGLGAFYRFRQYLGDASLRLDEINLVQNVLTRSLRELLTKPLDHHQVAPAGFLLLEKLATQSFGSSDRVLRLVPFLAALAALPLFWSLTSRLADTSVQLGARVLFALGFTFVWHGNDAKQYSTDIVIALGLTLITLKLFNQEERNRWPVAAIFAGVLAPWFSVPAALVLAGLGAAVLFEALQAGTLRWRSAVPILAVWGMGALVAGWSTLSTISTDTHRFMQVFWRGAFLPLPPWRLADLAWPIERLTSTFGGAGLRYLVPVAFLAVAVLGLVHLVRGPNRTLGLALSGPIIVTLLAAVVHVYPFAERLVAFLAPAMLIGLAVGVHWLAEALRGRWGVPQVASWVVLLVPAIGPMLLTPPVYRLEDTDPVLRYVATHELPTDPIYVSYGAGSAAQYYGPRLGLSSRSMIIGGCHRQDWRSYLRELDQFRVRSRLWLVTAHDLDGERRLMLDYLSTIGREVDSVVVQAHLPLHHSHGAAAYLFDLSDSLRLRAAASRTFRVVPIPSRVC